MAKPFRWISLFSGAGCGDLGLHRAGHEVVAMVEFDKAAAGEPSEGSSQRYFPRQEARKVETPMQRKNKESRISPFIDTYRQLST
jgi:hypothetical protein